MEEGNTTQKTENNAEILEELKKLKDELKGIKEDNKEVNKHIINNGVSVIKTKSRYEEMLEDLV